MPDGYVVNFPDDTPRQEILEAINASERRVEQQAKVKRQQEIEKERQETGIVGAFGRGLYRGGVQTAGLVGDVLPAIAADIFGADDYRDRQYKEYTERMQKLEEEAPSIVPSYQDITGIGSLAKYASETVGQFLPSVATSIAGGGVGGFVGRKVAEGFAKKAATDAARNMVTKGVVAGQIGGAFAGSGIQTIPEAYATLEQETGDYKLGASLLVGSFNAALDSILPAAFLTRLGRKGREEVSKNMLAQTLQKFGTLSAKTKKGNIARGALRGGIVEGLTEGTQQTNQVLASRILDENPEFFEEGDFAQILDATIRGAIGGKAFGSVSGAIQETQTQKQAREKQENETSLVNALSIVERGGGFNEEILQISVSEEYKNAKAQQEALLKADNLPPELKKILLDDSIPVERRVDIVRRTAEKLTGIAPKTKEEVQQEGIIKQTYQGALGRLAEMNKAGQAKASDQIVNEILESSKVIRLGDETIPLLQIEFDPNAKTEEQLTKIKKQAKKDLKRNHPIRQILESKDISTPRKIDIFNSFREKNLEMQDTRSEFVKDQEKIDEQALLERQGLPKTGDLELTKKSIELPDDRQTQYFITDKKGKKQNVPPFLDITEAESWVQEQNKPEKFNVTNQNNDIVFKGQQYTPVSKIVRERAKKKRDISPEEAQYNLLTGQNLDSPDVQASERGVDKKKPFSDEVSDDVAEQTIRKVDRESKLFIDARQTIENRIDEIAQRGDQGKKNAEGLRRILDEKGRTVGELAVAFEVADIMTRILPKQSGFALNFVEALKDGEVQGLLEMHPKIISLAMKRGAQNKEGQRFFIFDDDVIKETATHEAFHVLQKYFEKYDKGAFKILEQEFGTGYRNRIDYTKTRASKWISRVNPKLHQELIQINNEIDAKTGKPKLMAGSELQAYAFSAYERARREGNTPALTGGIARYFRFLTAFLERLGNKFKGLGFQTTEDIFEGVASGVSAKQLNDRTLSELDSTAEETPDAQASQRGLELLTRPNGEPFITDTKRSERLLPLNNGSTTIAKVQTRKDLPKKNVVLQQGERFFNVRKEKYQGHGADVVMHPSNINLIKLNTPHNDIVSFVQDVVTNGKKTEDRGRIIYRYKSPNYKQVGTVVLEQDDKNPKNFNVLNAFARDPNLISRQRAEEQRKAEEERQKRMREQESASQEDVQEYLKQRDAQASARPLAQIEINAGESVSSRFPTSVNKDGDPLTEFLRIDSNPIRQSPQALAKAARQIKEYNLLQPSEYKGLDDNAVLDLYIERGADNLLYIFDLISPEVRNRSKLWYEGANKIANRLAQKPVKVFKKNRPLTVEQTSGILAALSPQKDWFQNVSLAERLIDIMTAHSSVKFTSEMRKTGKRIFGKKQYAKDLEFISDKSLDDLMFEHPVIQAMWIRVYDETYNQRSHRIVSPEGDLYDYARSKKGDPKGTGWGSNAEIAKAVQMYRDDSMDTISKELGLMHKIRSFFNNIANPRDEKGSATIDTHAVAAIFLQPFSGKSIPVSHNFGVMATKGVEGSASVTAFGSKGYYGIHYEMYRMAAEKRGVLPREMQSITWEAIRGLFPAEFKTEENVKYIENIWNEYKKGNKTLDEARNEVIEYANQKTETSGFGTPDWGRSDSRTYEVQTDSSYERKLPSNELSRGRVGDDSRNGRDATTDVPVKTDLEQAFDEGKQFSERGVQILTDEEFSNAEFKRANGNRSPDNAKIKKLIFKNRNVPNGTRVALRPNLNGWVITDGLRVLTQTVHDPKNAKLGSKGVYGNVMGYDFMVAGQGRVDLDVTQTERFNIKSGKASKNPMAGGVGQYVNLTKEEMAQIVNNPDHVLSFNPFKHHLFVDQNGLAVKNYDGVGVHYNSNVYVAGDIEYWKQNEAPQPKGGLDTETNFIDQPYHPDVQESRRGFAQSWDEVLTTKNDSIVNNFLEGLKKVYRAKDFFVGEFINSTEPVGELEEIRSFQTTGVKKRLGVAEGAQRFMEMVMNRAGRNEMIMKYGAPVMAPDGTPSFDPDSKGMFQIFEDFTIEEYRAFSKYASARRAQALGAKEQFISPALIADGMSLENAKFKEAFDEYQKFNSKLLDFLVSAGMLDQKQKDNLTKYDYIPFYRIIEEDTYKAGVLFKSDVRGPNTTGVLNNPQKYIMEYSGGQKPIGDLVENMFRNSQALVDSAMKNKAMQKVVRLMEQTGVGQRVTKAQADSIKASEGGRVVSFRKNVRLTTGQVVNRQVFYDISEDPHLYASLAAMTPRQTAGLFKLMENVGRIFREGITHAPPFMLANLIRGDMAAFVTVDAPLTPFKDTVAGLKNALKETETIREMKLISGVGGYAMGDDFRDSARILQRQMRQRHRGYNIVSDMQGVTDLIRAGWSQLTRAGEATELATREAIYRKLIDQGMSKADAAYEALNVINFNRRGQAQTNVGVFVNSLLPLVPFLNARFQGLYRTFEPMTTGKQADRTKTLGKGMLLMGANLALYSLMSQDDRWREEPMHRKLAYHIIYPNVVGLEDVLGTEPILIPRAFEIGAIFTSLPELFIDGIREQNGDYVADGVLHTLINTFSFNPLPQALIPAIEVAANYDFFTGRQLDTPAMQRYIKSERVTATTPEAARLLSQKSMETLSPNQISQLIEGYLGTLGGYLLTAFDVAASGTGVIPNRPTGIFGSSAAGQFAEALGFGRFRKLDPDPSNRFIADFYEVKNEADENYATVQKLKREGRIEQAIELMEKKKSLLRFRTTLNAFSERLRVINRNITLVRMDEKASSDDKRKKLDGLLKSRRDVGRQLDKLLQQIREQ